MPNEEKDKFKFKTWLIPLPDFHFVHQTYNQSSDYRDFFGREKDVQDFVEVLKNTKNTSGSYLVTGYRGAGKTSFVKKVIDILSNGEPKLSSYNNFFSKIYTPIENILIQHFTKIYDFLYQRVKIPTTLILLFGLLYILFFPVGQWDFIVFPVLFMLYYFKKYHFAALDPKQWSRWIFNPVIQIPVNLGYEIKNPKDVIFSIISLLRNKYTEFYKRSFWNKLVLIALIIYSSIFAITTYRLFPEFHSYMETKINTVVGVNPNFIDDFCNGEISDKLILPHISEPDKWHLSITGDKKLEIEVAQSEASRSGYVSFIREFILVPSYCAVNYFSEDLFNYEHWKKPDDIYLLHRISYLFQSLENLVIFIDNIVFDNQYQEFYSDLRPYHVLHFFVIFLLLLFLRIWLNPIQRIIRRLDDLHKRIQASEILDSSRMPGTTFPFLRKKYQHFHRLDERQAENLLLEVLEDNANNFLVQPHIIFLFDELDNVHPYQEKQLRRANDDIPIELELSESIRKRQHEIEQLLGSLKNIISTAPCNFIFVAGREMLDANLADRGETRFLHGTLFDRIFYLSSFLNDPSDGNRDNISSMIEQYVCRRLMSPIMAKFSYFKLKKTDFAIFDDSANDYKYWSLKVYMQYLKNLGITDAHRFGLISFLQDFIYFLSYRSGGNTQKLSLQFEEFLQPMPKQYFPKSDKYHQISFSAFTNIKFVLHFDTQEQYRIQIISHLFTIFHGSYSKLISQYGDKLSVSLFSIFDYIFKFHSMGFSRRELERMPGALDIHRAPALPQILDLLLNRILLPYLNKIDNGFYSFHFARYIQREIVYISQFSQQEMAAFNFSLDESLQIKQHYQQFLEKQINLYQITDQIEKETLPSIHMILGDLHAQDNEFDQAMVEYENAIYHISGFIEKLLKECSKGTPSSHKNIKEYPYISYLLNKNKDKIIIKALNAPLIFYIRLMLRRGLLQERRMIYDSAIAFYYRAMETVDIISKSTNSAKFFEINIEQLNLLIQPYLCLAFLHAKRDSSLETARIFMHKSLELLEVKSGKSTGSKIFTEKSGQIYKHHVHCAEMYMMRSQFKEAICKYIDAMKAVCDCIASNNENAITYHDMGSVLAGLANACTALALYKFYDHQKSDFKLIFPTYKQDISYSKKELQIYYNQNLSDKELEKSLKHNVELIIELKCRKEKKLLDVLKHALGIYVLASHAYRLASSLLDEAFMLWETAYTVAFGLSYLKIVDKPDLSFDDKNKINWLFKHLDDTPRYKNNHKNPIRHAFSQAFVGSYSVHRARLKQEIGVTEEKVIRWIAPPLSKLLIVFGHFWHANCGETDENGNLCKMDESAFEIVDMGTFSMKARLLALYLKGRWYQENAEMSENEYQYKQQAFRFLVQAIEDGQAFEGENDYIALPLGMIFYHIWEIVKENDEENGQILSSIKKTEDFKGDMQRYFSLNYCHDRTKKRLFELLSRHNIEGINKERYFTYMSKHYYLYDSFADPYVNGQWALEYGLVPIAKFMLEKIDEDFDDEFF